MPQQGTVLQDLSNIKTKNKQPPPLVESKFCNNCKINFTLTNRRKHCRGCGQSFCTLCCNKYICIPSYGYYTSVRVCDLCYKDVFEEYTKQSVIYHATNLKLSIDMPKITSPISSTNKNIIDTKEVVDSIYKNTRDIDSTTNDTANNNTSWQQRRHGITLSKKNTDMNQDYDNTIDNLPFVSDKNRSPLDNKVIVQDTVMKSNILETFDTDINIQDITNDNNINNNNNKLKIKYNKNTEIDSDKDKKIKNISINTSLTDITKPCNKISYPQNMQKQSQNICFTQPDVYKPYLFAVKNSSREQWMYAELEELKNAWIQALVLIIVYYQQPSSMKSILKNSKQLTINNTKSPVILQSPKNITPTTLQNIASTDKYVDDYTYSIEDDDVKAIALAATATTVASSGILRNSDEKNIPPTLQTTRSRARRMGILGTRACAININNDTLYNDSDIELLTYTNNTTTAATATTAAISATTTTVNDTITTPITTSNTNIMSINSEEERKQIALENTKQWFKRYASSTIDQNDIEIDTVVATGAFGDIYKAYLWGTPVALKTLKKLIPTMKPEMFKDIINDKKSTKDTIDTNDVVLEHLEDLRKEIEIQSQLRHPNVVQYMGACQKQPMLCIVTEWCENGSLYDILHNHSICIDCKTMLDIAMGIAQGMNYQHNLESKIIHRDQKSHNILINHHFQVKVADFGQSHIRGSEGLFGLKYNGNTQSVNENDVDQKIDFNTYDNNNNNDDNNDNDNDDDDDDDIISNSTTTTTTMEKKKIITEEDKKKKKVKEDLYKRLKNIMEQKVPAVGVSDKYGIFGTPEWMAPEVMLGQKYTEKIDIYSYGIQLTEIVSRTTPYHDFQNINSYFDIANAVIENNAIPTIPKWCKHFLRPQILSCLDKNTNKRPNFTNIIRYLHNLQTLDEYYVFQNYDIPRIREQQNDKMFISHTIAAKEVAQMCLSKRVEFVVNSSKKNIISNITANNRKHDNITLLYDTYFQPETMEFQLHGKNYEIFSFLNLERYLSKTFLLDNNNIPNIYTNYNSSINYKRWQLPEDDGIDIATRISSLLSSSFLPTSSAGENDDHDIYCDNPQEMLIDECESFHLEMILSLIHAQLGLLNISDNSGRILLSEIIAGEGTIWSQLALLGARIKYESQILQRLRELDTIDNPQNILTKNAKYIIHIMVTYALLRHYAGQLLLAITWELPTQELHHTFYGVPENILDSFSSLLCNEIDMLRRQYHVYNLRSNARTHLLQIVLQSIPNNYRSNDITRANQRLLQLKNSVGNKVKETTKQKANKIDELQTSPLSHIDKEYEQIAQTNVDTINNEILLSESTILQGSKVSTLTKKFQDMMITSNNTYPIRQNMQSKNANYKSIKEQINKDISKIKKDTLELDSKNIKDKIQNTTKKLSPNGSISTSDISTNKITDNINLQGIVKSRLQKFMKNTNM